MRATITNLKTWSKYEVYDADDCQSMEERLVYNLAADLKAPVSQGGIVVEPSKGGK